MKIQCDRKRLLEAVKNACLVSPKSASDPILNNIKIETGLNNVSITATDYGVIYHETIPADIESSEQPTILVNADKLKKVLSKSKAGLVEIETDQVNWFSMKLDKLKTKLPGSVAETFPNCDFKQPEWKFKLSGNTLKDIAAKTLFAIGENESRKKFMGLHISQKDGNIMFEGADAYRIARYFTPKAHDFHETVILPKQSLKIIDKAFNWADTDWYFDRLSLTVHNDCQKFQSRLIDADYPMLDKLMAVQSSKLSVVPAELIEALDMMSVLTNNDGNAISKATFNASTINIESQKTEFSDGQVEIDCNYGAAVMSVGLNVRFFSDVAKIFKKYDEMNIHCAGPDKPIIFKTDECPAFESVLMPVRIQW